MDERTKADLEEYVRSAKSPFVESALQGYITSLKHRELARKYGEDTADWDYEIKACLEELKFELERCAKPSDK